MKITQIPEMGIELLLGEEVDFNLSKPYDRFFKADDRDTNVHIHMKDDDYGVDYWVEFCQNFDQKHSRNVEVQPIVKRMDSYASVQTRGINVAGSPSNQLTLIKPLQNGGSRRWTIDVHGRLTAQTAPRIFQSVRFI